MCFTIFFFFNDTATTEIYTLSLHDALPISSSTELVEEVSLGADAKEGEATLGLVSLGESRDRKSTRLNSSHANISYAVFCLKKKKILRTSPNHSNTKCIPCPPPSSSLSRSN